MAGKEFKTRSRTVQKMSRDGLVEENLRTRKTRKVRAADTGERIGDRPMEEYSEGQALTSTPDSSRNLRLDRRGDAMELAGETQGTGEAIKAGDVFSKILDKYK